VDVMNTIVSSRFRRSGRPAQQGGAAAPDKKNAFRSETSSI